MTTLLHRSRSNRGFTLIEMLIATGITVVVMASVFQLLKRGQDSFTREPEVADMTANARAGLDLISRDLAWAGLGSPPTMTIMWSDGGGINPANPDELTIVFADADVAISAPMCTGKGNGCGNLKNGSTLWIDKDSFVPPVADPTSVYKDGQVLFAIETEDCNGDGPSIIPFTLTKPPKMSGGKLHLAHNPKGKYNTNKGFNDQVQEGLRRHRRVSRDSVPHQPSSSRGQPGPRKARHRSGRRLDPGSREHREPSVSIQPGNRAAIRRRARGLASDANDPNSWITGVRISVSGKKREHQLERRHDRGLRCRGYAFETDVHHLGDPSKPARASSGVGGGERHPGMELGCQCFRTR